jgi:uncharacterized membrane protein YidH (DUF202 family)
VTGDRDPGLQSERTALAWSRTALALLVNAALFLRATVEGRSRALLAVGLLLLITAGLAGLHALKRRRQLAKGGRSAVVPAVVLAGLAFSIAVSSAGVLGLLGMAIARP